MEYPFKDLMPLDEATARDGYYKDWTHIDADTFHQISELVKFIREKGYGSDTREAIAQALERVYHDAMKSGNADMELSMARKHFKDLASRLDASDNDMRNISVDWINKNLGKLDQTFMTDEFLQQMAGNTPINAVPADYSITTKKLSGRVVNPNSTTFLDKLKIEATEYGYSNFGFLGSSSSQATIGLGSRKTLLFPVKPNTKYKITKTPSNIFRIAAHTSMPQIIDGFQLDRFIKDEYLTGVPESTETSFSFRTNATDAYVMIYVSSTGQTPAMTVEEDKELEVKDSIIAENITIGKNLFNPKDYINGFINGEKDKPELQTFSVSTGAKTAFFKVRKNTNYAISKTEDSNRFRVALTNDTPENIANISIQTPENDGIRTEPFVVNSGDFEYLLVTVTNNDGNKLPSILQIEESSTPTAIENFGYRFYPEAKTAGILTERAKDGKVYVEDFGGANKSDTDMIQDALDYAGGSVVVFKSGKEYNTNRQLIADLSKVRGIEGNNAKIIGDLNAQSILKYYGSLSTSGSTGPQYGPNEAVQENEMNGFIDQLNVRSKTPYLADGIEVGNSIGIVVRNSKMYKLRNGLISSGIGRNFLFIGNYIYNNAENGILYYDTDLHQHNIIGGHISHNKNNIKFLDSDIANVMLSGVSLENAKGVGYDNPESLITFESSGVLNKVAKHLYEVILITGCNLQDHGANTKPLINVDLMADMMMDLTVSNSQIGNCGAGTVPIYLKGTSRTLISGVNTFSNSGANSIVLAGVNSATRITNNHLLKPISYAGSTGNKLLVANNITSGFTLPDSNDGNILIKDNL